MKNTKRFSSLTCALMAALCAAVVLSGVSLLACMGSKKPVCTVNPAACLKSMVLAKSVPGPIFPIPPAGSGFITISNNLFITCPQTNNCGSVCTNLGVPVSASLTVTLSPPAACPPGAPTLGAAISTAAGSMTLPVCSPLGTFNPYLVTVIIPGGTCPGVYSVVGTATVTFSDGTVLTQTGDTVICLVQEAPGQPGVPRLSVELLTPSFPRMAPGDQHLARYLVRNNDLSNSVTLTAFATSKQNAVRPQGGNEAQGIFTISSPFGDDFPIMFNPGTGCIPLPSHPYTQQTISNSLPVLPPGGTNVVIVGIRSYGQCASGSCSESTLRVQGFFSDSTPAFSCASMAFYADTSVPSQTCALLVNDCNHNGIPDALDIDRGTSQDQNFNALPDECESAISVPFFASVSPTNPAPGATIQVQVAFNEVIPMSNVWATGTALIKTQFFGSPLWVGTIPADTRPGPQTVYFLGKDALGGLASYIATYQVVSMDTNPPTLTSATCTSSTRIVVRFSEKVDAATALNAANYAIEDLTGAKVILYVTLDPDGQTVNIVLTTPAQGLVTVSVSNVTDAAGNAINQGSTVTCDIPSSPLIITRTTASQGQVTIAWSNGIGPFLVQMTERLIDPEWEVVRMTIARTATLTQTVNAAFFRIVDQKTGSPLVNVFTDRQNYFPNELVRATVEVAGSGTLSIDVFDTAAPEGPSSVIFHDSLPVSAGGGSVTQVLRTFGAPAEGHYRILAQLVSNGNLLGEGLGEFGVRSPSLTGIPQEILRASLESLDVPLIRDQLRFGASNGVPVTLQLGTYSIQLDRVHRPRTFDPDPGAQIPPALVGVETYQGELAGLSNSIAMFTIGPDAPDGNDLNGLILNPLGFENPGTNEPAPGTLWIEPVRLYNSNAPPQMHVLYQGEDVVLGPDAHSPLTTPPNLPPGTNSLSGGHSLKHTENRVVRVRVYEHFVSAARTHSRCNIFYAWAAIMRSEFVNITPRQSTAHNLTVSDAVFTSWTSLSTSGYGGSCNAVVSKFAGENNSANNRLYLLYTTIGSGCGGIAYLGQGASTRWHSMVHDNGSAAWTIAVLGQETGHNLDWHSSWSGPPHDAHLCTCISEQWNHKHGWWIFSWNHKHCTMMRASYGGCEQAELRYHRSYNDPLRHLAEGIWRYFP